MADRRAFLGTTLGAIGGAAAATLATCQPVSAATPDILQWTVPLTGNAGTNPNAINSKLAAAQSAGGGTVYLPAGTWPMGGPRVTVPEGVNLVGQGGGLSDSSSGTSLKFTGPGGGVSFIGRGGISGGFLLDGNNVAATPLVSDVTIRRQFQDVHVARAAEVAVLVLSSQNDLWSALRISNSAGDGLVLDEGAGGNTWVGLGVNDAGGAHLRIHETGGGGGGYPVPTDNVFYHSIFELCRAGSDGLAVVGESNKVKFRDCEFSMGTAAGTMPAALVTLYDGHDVHFSSCKWHGHDRGKPAIVQDGTDVLLDGWSQIQQCSAAVHYVGGGWRHEGVIKLQNTPTKWVGPGNWAANEIVNP